MGLSCPVPDLSSHLHQVQVLLGFLHFFKHPHSSFPILPAENISSPNKKGREEDNGAMELRMKSQVMVEMNGIRTGINVSHAHLSLSLSV